VNVVNVVPMPMRVFPEEESESVAHVSVLLNESVDALAPRAGGLYVDATLGAGGHSEALLQQGATVIGIDRDEVALALARERLSSFGERFVALHGAFSDLGALLERQSVQRVDGILADVGVSSMQLDESDRGLSFRREGPLDMRMDRGSGETALELIARLGDDDLANLIYRFGEERRSRRIARCIKQAYSAGELATTLDLRRAIVRAVGPARVGGVDPATRTFQALRIAVNGELDELTALLSAARSLLVDGGVMAVISFHSLEDRIVKREFQARDVWAPLTKKPLPPSEAEQAANPRARSAKLRAARRLGKSSLEEMFS
jgi:16S rRNA (cytosine1402-N4)-methyltransferase